MDKFDLTRDQARQCFGQLVDEKMLRKVLQASLALSRVMLTVTERADKMSDFVGVHKDVAILLHRIRSLCDEVTTGRKFRTIPVDVHQ